MHPASQKTDAFGVFAYPCNPYSHTCATAIRFSVQRLFAFLCNVQKDIVPFTTALITKLGKTPARESSVGYDARTSRLSVTIAISGTSGMGAALRGERAVRASLAELGCTDFAVDRTEILTREALYRKLEEHRIPVLYTLGEVARKLGVPVGELNGTAAKRRLMPPPLTRVGGRPVWTEAQLSVFRKRFGIPQREASSRSGEQHLG